VDAFSDEEITLLTELTNDLAYGITALRLQADHVRLEMELQQSHDLLEEKVKERTKQLSASQKTLRQYSEKLRVHSQTLIQAQEAERKAIAYELHDEIGQVMTAIQFNLQGISQSHDHVDVPARLDESIELIAQLLKQVRELSVGLRPWMLDQLGIVPAVRWYIDKQAERGNFTVEFNAEQVTGRFPPIVEITVYRIIQEAITNILRHAQATSVVVSLTRTNETFVAKINDNGIGFDSTTIHGMPLHEHGFGMIGMSERISSLGGRMDITSSPGNGTAIFFELPLNE
jgi:signal transduction histidine kinase